MFTQRLPAHAVGSHWRLQIARWYSTTEMVWDTQMYIDFKLRTVVFCIRTCFAGLFCHYLCGIHCFLGLSLVCSAVLLKNAVSKVILALSVIDCGNCSCFLFVLSSTPTTVVLVFLIPIAMVLHTHLLFLLFHIFFFLRCPSLYFSQFVWTKGGLSTAIKLHLTFNKRHLPRITAFLSDM